MTHTIQAGEQRKEGNSKENNVCLWYLSQRAVNLNCFNMVFIQIKHETKISYSECGFFSAGQNMKPGVAAAKVDFLSWTKHESKSS